MRFESPVHFKTMLVSLREKEIRIKIWETTQIKNTDILKILNFLCRIKLYI